MKDTIALTARLAAYDARHAMLIRRTRAIADDPQAVFAIAAIRMMSEQRVQAIAFGKIDEAPEIVCIWNPLSRESQNLEPFALALDAYLRTCEEQGVLPRFWVANQATVDVLEMLGQRYWRNPRASDSLRMLGWQCRILTEEVEYPGQQVVAVAVPLLTTHVVTGQMPVEDLHLGALLAWIDPPPDVDPLLEGRQRAHVPAAALLIRDQDERVEQLRRLAKRAARRGAHLASPYITQIETILEQGVRHEWELLVQAHQKFWALPLAEHDAASDLVDASIRRMARARSDIRRLPSRPEALSRLLDEIEHAVELAKHADILADPVERERARRAGVVFDTLLMETWQPRRSRKPCRLILATGQGALRARDGSRISCLDANIRGRVEQIIEEESGRRRLVVLVLEGIRAAGRLRPGQRSEWTTREPFARSDLKNPAYQAMRIANSPLAYATTRPSPVTNELPAGDLVAAARDLRRTEG